MTEFRCVDKVSSHTGDRSEVGEDVSGPSRLIEDVFVVRSRLEGIDGISARKTVGVDISTSFATWFESIIEVTCGTETSVVDEIPFESGFTL